jgi:hypothetical protein
VSVARGAERQYDRHRHGATMSKTLGSILEGYKKRSPNLISDLINDIVTAGIPLDLGPMTPDVRAAFDKITADAKADLKKKFTKPDASE